MSKHQKKKKTPAIDRPFDAQILADAERTASLYQIVLWREDGEWFGRGVELPNVFGDGPTPAKCVANILEALTTGVAYLLELGEQPPPPAREGVRTEQVNVRLSAEERLGFESAAKARGFKGLSDFIRAAALDKIK